MNRAVIQLGLGAGVLLFSLFATLFEGSEIVDRPFEWEYSTPFSGEVNAGSDISKLDYFVYAIKFKPTFPIVMAISILYILVVAGYLFISRKRFYSLYLPVLAVLQLIFGWFMFSATTSGAQALSYVFIACGLVFLLIALMYHFPPSGRRIGNRR
ncbi:YjdJ family protein [Bacillus haikouensis]|nr:YjdJ family protein [Bacillus haikouensis]